MPKQPQTSRLKYFLQIKAWLRVYWRRGIWQKVVCSFWAVFILLSAIMFAVSQWYAYTQRHKPMVFGTSFVAEYAQSLGVDPQETMDGLLDMGIAKFRLVSYWSVIETNQGTYDFSQLDWQFEKAEAKGVKISLAIGLRQPRWPECHMPEWAKTQPQHVWQPQLEKFMSAVVNRYKDSPSLESYQLENEYFLMGFGKCTNHDRQRLIDEYRLVKRLDPTHPVIISRSNNALGIPIGEPKPDMYAISVYKRVWDARITKRYLEYPPPGWFYGFLAGWQKLNDGRDMIIHELQAEAWAPNYKSLTDISLEEQRKSLDAERLAKRFDYARSSGMKEAYLWGSEYWYYRMKVLNDPSLWDTARKEFSEQNNH